jgi:hypothetical protein
VYFSLKDGGCLHQAKNDVANVNFGRILKEIL